MSRNPTINRLSELAVLAALVSLLASACYTAGYDRTGEDPSLDGLTCVEELGRDESGVAAVFVTDEVEFKAAAKVCDTIRESANQGQALLQRVCSSNDPAGRINANAALYSRDRCTETCRPGACLGLSSCVPGPIDSPSAINATCSRTNRRCGRGGSRVIWNCSVALTTGNYSCTCDCS